MILAVGRLHDLLLRYSSRPQARDSGAARTALGANAEMHQPPQAHESDGKFGGWLSPWYISLLDKFRLDTCWTDLKRNRVVSSEDVSLVKFHNRSAARGVSIRGGFCVVRCVLA